MNKLSFSLEISKLKLKRLSKQNSKNIFRHNHNLTINQNYAEHVNYLNYTNIETNMLILYTQQVQNNLTTQTQHAQHNLNNQIYFGSHTLLTPKIRDNKFRPTRMNNKMPKLQSSIQREAKYAFQSHDIHPSIHQTERKSLHNSKIF